MPELTPETAAETTTASAWQTYQDAACSTAVFPPSHALTYLSAYLASESGEVSGKIAKAVRDDGALTFADLTEDRIQAIAAELGDVLWGVAVIAANLGIPLEQIADGNLAKLASRQERGVLGGSGDHR